MFVKAKSQKLCEKLNPGPLAEIPATLTPVLAAVVIGCGLTAVKIFIRLRLQKFVPTVRPQPLVRVQARV